MIYSATGGVTQCKYKVAKTLSGEWIYAPCEDDETVWVYHCSLCGALSAQKHSFCRGCGAEMKMEVENEE
jgi:rRNA maturation endonuclease Nob1